LIGIHLSRSLLFIARGPALAEPRLWRGVVSGIPFTPQNAVAKGGDRLA